MMTSWRAIILLVSGLFLATARGARTDQASNAFLPLYQAGDYEKALQTLLDSPSPKDANFFYNLGTTQLRLGSFGKAVAYLEKASRLRGFDADTYHNLSASRAALGRVIGTERLDPASSWIDLASDRLSSPEVQAAASLAALVLLALALRAHIRAKIGLGSREFAIAGSFLGSLLLAVSVSSRSFALGRPAVFVTERQQIRSGPGDHFLDLGQVEAGVTLRLMGPQSEGWKQVRFTSDQIGWIKSAAVLE